MTLVECYVFSCFHYFHVVISCKITSTAQAYKYVYLAEALDLKTVIAILCTRIIMQEANLQVCVD